MKQPLTALKRSLALTDDDFKFDAELDYCKSVT